MNHTFDYFIGIDWGNERHRVCIVDPAGDRIDQRWTENSGSGLADLAVWLPSRCSTTPDRIAIAIEVPRGPVVESLMERGFAIFSINPKQLDRFRDRFSPAGAKDDSRAAWVLADSLRTDAHCFRHVRADEPAVLRLRELSRLDDDLRLEVNRLQNQLRDQWLRFFPQLLQLSSAAEDAWVWDLFEAAPLPAQAAKLSPKTIERILAQHRVRRFAAPAVRSILLQPPLRLTAGSAEAASEHALLLLPRLRLVAQQRGHVARHLEAVLDQLSAPAEGQTAEHRDAKVLLSLPGVGTLIAAAMLSEASQAIGERDYHALRCYAGVAPVTRQSGKKSLTFMRRGCNPKLRHALYHWARGTIVLDPITKTRYAQLRAHGQSHGRALRALGDRWLAVLISMLKHHSLYDPSRRAA